MLIAISTTLVIAVLLAGHTPFVVSHVEPVAVCSHFFGKKVNLSKKRKYRLKLSVSQLQWHYVITTEKTLADKQPVVY